MARAKRRDDRDARLISYRPFRNYDPPALADIWRSHPPLRGLASAVTPAVLEDRVYGKPYFDRRGLIIAIEDERPIGFVHAGFSPNGTETDLDYTQGVICRLMVTPHPDRTSILRELVSAAEDYLRSRGAVEISAGGVSPHEPFYLGLYGGAGLPGLIEEDDLTSLFRTLQYSELGVRYLVRRPLTMFRAPIDRDIMMARRNSQMVVVIDPKPQTWWEACRWAALERLQYQLLVKRTGKIAATATFWEIQPLSMTWGVRTAGLVSLEATDQARCDGSLTLLLADAMKHLADEGFHAVEILIGPDEVRLQPQLAVLGFTESCRGLVMKKRW